GTAQFRSFGRILRTVTVWSRLCTLRRERGTWLSIQRQKESSYPCRTASHRHRRPPRIQTRAAGSFPEPSGFWSLGCRIGSWHTKLNDTYVALAHPLDTVPAHEGRRSKGARPELDPAHPSTPGQAGLSARQDLAPAAATGGPLE